jgi:hypothetical protein
MGAIIGEAGASDILHMKTTPESMYIRMGTGAPGLRTQKEKNFIGVRVIDEKSGIHSACFQFRAKVNH